MYLKNFSLLLFLTVFCTAAQTETQKASKTANEYNLYSGTFDVIDVEGDEKTNLFGIEHKNENLFRDTIIGKFSPVTGGFLTGKNSVYLYTGVQAEYGLGRLKIVPSFTPGYYEAGDGKDLGSALEFKSEIKLNFDIFKNSKIGYSYGHISNNDWGKGGKNPGVNNEQISFSTSF